MSLYSSDGNVGIFEDVLTHLNGIKNLLFHLISLFHKSEIFWRTMVFCSKTMGKGDVMLSKQ